MSNLTECKDCGHTVSIRAKTCPSCGVDKPGEKDPTFGEMILGLLVLAAIIGGVYYWFSTRESEQQTPQQVQREINLKRMAAATLTARDAISDALKAPSTATFSDYDETEVGRLKGTENQWVVRGYVDAENSFGAKIRTNYQVIVEFEPDSNVISKIVSVNELK